VPFQVNAGDRIVCGVVPNEAQPLFALTQGSATCDQFGIGAAKHIDFPRLLSEVATVCCHLPAVPHLRLGCTRTVGLLLLKLA
jgi:hypothetical protein